MLAGVAQDGALYLLELNASTGAIGKFRDTGALRPPPTDGNSDVTAGIPLDRQLRGRLPVWTDVADPNGFLVAVSAGDSVWVWRENSANESASQWIPFGSPPTTQAKPTASISNLVYLADSATMFALRGGQAGVACVARGGTLDAGRNEGWRNLSHARRHRANAHRHG